MPHNVVLCHSRTTLTRKLVYSGQSGAPVLAMDSRTQRRFICLRRPSRHCTCARLYIVPVSALANCDTSLLRRVFRALLAVRGVVLDHPIPRVRRPRSIGSWQKDRQFRNHPESPQRSRSFLAGTPRRKRLGRQWGLDCDPSISGTASWQGRTSPEGSSSSTSGVPPMCQLIII